MKGPFAITGIKADAITLMIRADIILRALRIGKNPLTAIKVLRELIRLRKVAGGGRRPGKYFRIGRSYHWGLNAPGWPSKSFTSFVESELSHRIHHIPRKGRRLTGEEGHIPGKEVRSRYNRHLQTIIFSITSRCPLRCDHCFEWDTMNSGEHLSLEQLKEILAGFRDRGVSQVQFSGGEPLVRFDDLLELIRSTGPENDAWLLTSGYGLTKERAEDLREAGLKGVNISLDHWDENGHNEFRGCDDSYAWVMKGAGAAREAGLALCLSLCARREFVSEDNLIKYLRLASGLGACFVQLLEPRRTGRYSGRDVELAPEQIRILDDFFLATTLEKRHDRDPLVSYPGHHQRLEGCFGAGDRYLHIDSRGDLHACPFCRGSAGSALDGDLEAAIDRLRQIGCHAFDPASVPSKSPYNRNSRKRVKVAGDV